MVSTSCRSRHSLGALLPITATASPTSGRTVLRHPRRIRLTFTLHRPERTHGMFIPTLRMIDLLLLHINARPHPVLPHLMGHIMGGQLRNTRVAVGTSMTGFSTFFQHVSWILVAFASFRPWRALGMRVLTPSQGTANIVARREAMKMRMILAGR